MTSEATSQAAARTLRERGLRATPQRRAIWTAFEGGAAGHLTADDVLRRARREVSELSRATVYNALRELVEVGLLRVLESARSRLYDANAAAHHHFRCRVCRRLFDVGVAGVGRVRLAGAGDGFAVEQTQILFEGVCPDCR
jgi:Fur family transcriptional regulator, stress-responsive regulator